MNPSPSTRRFAERSASFIGAVSLAGRLLERGSALVQIMLIAAVLGSSAQSDLYFIASIIPLMIGGICGEGLYVSILPVAVGYQGNAEKLFSAGFWISTGLLAALSACYVASVAVVVPIAEPTGSGSLLPWLAFTPIVIFLGLGTYCAAVLLYYERYVLPPFRSAAASIVATALSALVLAFGGGVIALGLAICFGYASALLLLALEIRSIGRQAVFRLPERQFLRPVLERWRQFVESLSSGLVGGQVFVLIERALAAPLGVGAVSSLSYARGVAFTPNLLSSSIAQGIYPSMMRAWAHGALPYVREQFLSGLRLTVFVAMVTATYTAVYAGDVATVLFDWGAVTTRSLVDLSHALAAFSLGLIGTALMILTARVLSAVDYFRGIVMCQATALVVYLVLAPVLRSAAGTPGLAFAFGIAEIVGASVAVVIVARRVGLVSRTVFVRALAPAFGRGLVVACALLLARLVLSEAQPTSLVVVIGGCITGAVATAGILGTAAWPELRHVKRLLRGGIRA